MKDLILLAAALGGAWVSYDNFTQAKALEASDPARAKQKKNIGYIAGVASVGASIYGGFKALKKMT